MITKECKRCGIIKDSDKFYVDKTTTSGLRGKCIECMSIERKMKPGVKEYDVIRNKRHARKKKRYEANKRRALKNPHKEQARAILQASLRYKKIARPISCYFCDKETKLDGHHHDYKKPLDVTWLCRSCHTRLHMYLDKSGVKI